MTGIRAAETIFHVGVTESAFREAFAGRRIAADRLTIRLTPPARLLA